MMAETVPGQKKTENPPDRNLRRMEYRSNHIDDFLSLFSPELEKPLDACDVLDVGCGRGVISLAMAPGTRSVHGIDLEPEFVELCRNESKKRNYSNARFTLLSALELKDTEKYDIVILSDVLEHVEEQEKLLKICMNALRPGGVLYISTNNKWWPIEGHKFLPFLTYLPRGMANRYVSFMGKGKDYEGYFLPSYWHLKKLLNGLPISYAFKPPVNPERLIYKIGVKMVKASQSFWMFANAFQVIVKKKAD